MKQKLFYTTEGRILITGFLLLLILLIGIFYCAVIDIETAKTLVLTFIAHTFGGRAAGVGLCIMNEFGPVSTILYNFYLEMLIVCFAYSIFVLTTKQYIRVKWLTNLMDKIALKAVEQKEKVRSFGWIGLFIFVMVPLPITGPVMGSVIGYLLRVNLIRNFTATGAGTLTAIIIWFYCFDFLEQRFHVIQYIFAGILLLVIISRHKSIIKFFFGKKK